MRRYLVHRLMAALFVLVGVSFVVFLALHLTAGDPAQILLGPMATPAERFIASRGPGRRPASGGSTPAPAARRRAQRHTT